VCQECGFYRSVCLTVIKLVIFFRHKVQVAETNISLNTDVPCVQQFKNTLPTFDYACPVVVTSLFSSVLRKFGMVGASSFILHAK
jgi:hypothetical protein